MPFPNTMTMNRRILAIALPSIVTNITVPLLGLIDITIAGHLGRTEYIGAIAVGAMMFNLIYWNFGFLRMGTAGMTAQAFGRNDAEAQASILARATALAAIIAAAILLLQIPLRWIMLRVVNPSDEVAQLARTYFNICVWGAPAMLIDMALKGWFIGMQDSRTPMFMAIGINIANICTSLAAVFLLDMGFAGIATGTVIAEYAGMAYGIGIILHRHKRLTGLLDRKRVFVPKEIKRFFSINGDIFLRSACLMLVNLFFVFFLACSGDVTLAVNALIMQLFTLYSYFMDGFAFSGEALAGRYSGARDKHNLGSSIKHIFGWGVAVAATFTIAYAIGAKHIFGFITDNATVIAEALDYRWWCVAIPAAGMAGFVWDGVYIGLTATREMLVTIVISCATFFALYFIMPASMGNDKLWLAFVAYLAMRGISQTAVFRHRIKSRIDQWQ